MDSTQPEQTLTTSTRLGLKGAPRETNLTPLASRRLAEAMQGDAKIIPWMMETATEAFSLNIVWDSANESIEITLTTSENVARYTTLQGYCEIRARH